MLYGLTRLMGVPGLILTLLATPLAAEAQQAGKVYRVGLLTMGTVAPDVPLWNGFLSAMRELDYTEGRNLLIRVGAAGDGRPDRLPEFVTGFLRERVDVIVTTSTRETQAAKSATPTTPIVMTLPADPVGQGLVASLARPGGSVTGLTSLVPGVSQKYVELLKEAAPSASAFVVVTGPRGPFQEIHRDLDVAARRVGVTLSYARVNGPSDIDRALTQATKEGAGGLIAPLDVVTGMHRDYLARVAVEHRLPSTYWQRTYVDAGGLLLYGASLVEVGRRAAYFVDRVLKGARPADLPVEQPTAFELVVNLKTAKALGLTIPPSVLARADEVIQ